jgi:hypothetical protein
MNEIQDLSKQQLLEFLDFRLRSRLIQERGTQRTDLAPFERLQLSRIRLQRAARARFAVPGAVCDQNELID